MSNFGAQQSPQGIAALSMGNPAPLQKRVEQGGKDPQTGLPKDLIDALALNIVTNEQDAGKRQAAMQQLQQAAGPTGQMPTVVQNLQQQAQQKMAALQQRAMQQAQAQQAQAQQAQAPQGQGIDQAPVEFGMAGGGIVAFAKGGDEGEYETRYDRMNRENRERAEQELADRIEAIRASGNEAGATTYGHQMSELGNAIDRVVPDPVQLFRKLVSDPSLEREGAATKQVERGRPTMANDPRLAELSKPAPTMGGLRAAPGVAAGPASAGQAIARPAGNQGIAGSAPREIMDPMEKAIRDNIMKTMAVKDDDEYAKGVERFNKTAGIDALLKDMSDRATARESRFAEAKASRTPEWVRALQSMGGAPVRGGIGMMLGQMGAAATKARDAYSDEDLAFAKEIDTMRDAITKAKLDGNVKAANAGEQALKDLIANKRQAEQSGTSLLNTQEQARTRKQIAADNAAARADARAAGLADKQIATAINMVKNDELINRWQKDADALSKTPTQSNKAAVMELERKIAERQQQIYQSFKVPGVGSKMPAAPGAASPGGTSTSGWGKASVVTP
jgi:hypothetical protein